MEVEYRVQDGAYSTRLKDGNTGFQEFFWVSKLPFTLEAKTTSRINENLVQIVLKRVYSAFSLLSQIVKTYIDS